MKNVSTVDGNRQMYVFFLLFLVVSVALLYSFHIDKHLSADGVHYFCVVLDSGRLTDFAWSRLFANLLTQWPLVLAVRAGINNIAVLSKIYAAGIYFPYVFSFVICLYALRDERKVLLLFPLLSMAGINLSSDYILSGEHHVMVTMSWPILFLLLKRRALTWIEGCLLWVLLLLFSRLYETAVVPALIFIIMCSIRLRSYRQKQQLIICGIALVICLAVVVISVYFIVYPRDPANRAHFLRSMTAVFRNREAVTAGSFSLFFTIGLLLQKRMVMLFAAFPLLGYVFLAVFAKDPVTANVSFASRTLSATFLPILMVGAVLAWYLNRELDRASIVVFCTFIVVMTAGNLWSSTAWKEVHNEMTKIVRSRQGYVSIEETVLGYNRHRWGWNNPELGLVWSAPCVRAIILNRHNVRWEPFDPRRRLILKRFLKYDPFFKSVDNDITICDGGTPL